MRRPRMPLFRSWAQLKNTFSRLLSTSSLVRLYKLESLAQRATLRRNCDSLLSDSPQFQVAQMRHRAEPSQFYMFERTNRPRTLMQNGSPSRVLDMSQMTEQSFLIPTRVVTVLEYGRNLCPMVAAWEELMAQYLMK